MDLPVAWLPCQHKLPPTSSSRNPVHLVPINRFTISSYGLSPIDVHKNTRKIEASIWRYILPPPRIPSGKVKFCGNSRFPTKTWKPRRKVPEEREQPPTAYIFQSNAGLEVLHIKKPPSLSVPASAKDLTPFFQPGPLIRRNPTQQCLPLGEERVVFLGSPFQSPRNWFLPQIGVGNPEFQKYIDWLTEVNWFSSCEHI